MPPKKEDADDALEFIRVLSRFNDTRPPCVIIWCRSPLNSVYSF